MVSIVKPQLTVGIGLDACGQVCMSGPRRNSCCDSALEFGNCGIGQRPSWDFSEIYRDAKVHPALLASSPEARSQDISIVLPSQVQQEVPW